MLGARNVCDREFIHLSGAVQPHGFLLVVDPVSLVVAACANVPHLLGCNAELLGLALGDVLGPEAANAVRAMHPTSNPHDALPARIRLPVAGQMNKPLYDMVAHRSGPLLVLEFEENGDTNSAMFALFFQRQRNAVKALLTLDDVDLICQLTVQEVQK